jgi:hypothetical protein
VTRFEFWSIGVASAATVINLAAVLFVGVQVRQAAVQSRRATLAQQEEWVKARKRATVEFYMSTEPLNSRLKAALPFLDRNAEAAAEFLEAAERDPDAAAAIRAYLDYLETLAAGANEGVLDLSTIDRMTGSRIVAVAANYAPYIERRRGELGAPGLYRELERLAELIAAHRARGSGG